jgi:hypothetical protein
MLNNVVFPFPSTGPDCPALFPIPSIAYDCVGLPKTYLDHLTRRFPIFHRSIQKRWLGGGSDLDKFAPHYFRVASNHNVDRAKRIPEVSAIVIFL